MLIIYWNNTFLRSHIFSHLKMKYVLKNVIFLDFFTNFELFSRVSPSLILFMCMTLLFTYRVNVDIEAAKTIYDDA